MKWYLKVVRDNYANFKGRARRKEYWMFCLFSIIFALVTLVADYLLGTILIVYGLYLIALILPSFAVTIRRMHDIGKSGWWLLITLIPLIGSIMFLVFMCKNSQEGENQYGPSPIE